MRLSRVVLKKHLLAVLISICLTFVLWSQLLLHMDAFVDGFPMFTQGKDFDGYNFNVHVLEAQQENIKHHEPLFGPEQNAYLRTGFRYVLLGTFLLLTGIPSALIAHNIIILWSFFLYLLSMYALTFLFTRRSDVSLIAILLAASCSFVVNSIIGGQANTFTIHWFAIQVLFLELMIRNKKLTYAVMLGLASVMQFLISAQYFSYAIFLMVIYTLCRVPWKNILNMWKHLLATGLIISISITIYMLLFSLPGNNELYWRSLDENNLQGTTISSLTGVCSSHFVLIPILLGGVGFIFAIRKRKKGIIAIGGIGILALLLSLGPKTWFHPYTWFYYLWPTAKMFRSPYKFLPFAFQTLTVTSMYAASLLFQKMHKRIWRFLWYAICVILLILLLSQNCFLQTLHHVPYTAVYDVQMLQS